MHALSNVCFTKCVWAAKEHIWSRFGASKIQSNIGKCSLLECYNDLHNGFNCSDFETNWATFKMISFWDKITFKTAIFGGHFRPPKKWSLNWTCSSCYRVGPVGRSVAHLIKHALRACKKNLIKCHKYIIIDYSFELNLSIIHDINMHLVY